jgi:hypothetical protein
MGIFSSFGRPGGSGGPESARADVATRAGALAYGGIVLSIVVQGLPAPELVVSWREPLLGSEAS